jgi:hypothetical protein
MTLASGRKKGGPHNILRFVSSCFCRFSGWDIHVWKWIDHGAGALYHAFHLYYIHTYQSNCLAEPQVYTYLGTHCMHGPCGTYVRAEPYRFRRRFHGLGPRVPWPLFIIIKLTDASAAESKLIICMTGWQMMEDSGMRLDNDKWEQSA